MLYLLQLYTHFTLMPTWLEFFFFFFQILNALDGGEFFISPPTLSAPLSLSLFLSPASRLAGTDLVCRCSLHRPRSSSPLSLSLSGRLTCFAGAVEDMLRRPTLAFRVCVSLSLSQTVGRPASQTAEGALSLFATALLCL
jgi:hypothetical protein